MSVALFILSWVILHGDVNGEFNRDVRVYDGVIRDIQRYFKNGNVVFFYAADDLGRYYSFTQLYYSQLSDHILSHSFMRRHARRNTVMDTAEIVQQISFYISD